MIGRIKKYMAGPSYEEVCSGKVFAIIPIGEDYGKIAARFTDQEFTNARVSRRERALLKKIDPPKGVKEWLILETCKLH